MAINIAIDGPSAAGKSTIANILSQRLNYVHLDTGAMYRCVALAAKERGIQYDDEPALDAMMNDISIRLSSDGRVFLDGKDVSAEIRTDEMSMGASSVSKLQAVRTRLVAMQQKMASAKGFIMDGRDIGTVVLKDAAVKIFMTASIEARAKRRYLDNKQRGLDADLHKLEQEIAQRDYQDTHRAISPLTKAPDAIEIDTSDMSIEQVVDSIMEIVNQRSKEH